VLATGGERVDQVRQHLRVAATALAAVDMDALLQHPRLAEAACQAGDRRQPSEAGPETVATHQAGSVELLGRVRSPATPAHRFISPPRGPVEPSKVNAYPQCLQIQQGRQRLAMAPRADGVS